MSDPAEARNLLKDLEAQQDEVLRKLDELNRRLEETLAQWLGGNLSQKPGLSLLSADAP